MNSTQTPSGGEPDALAPSVDTDWLTAFVIEQRLLDVPGATIGDALATIEGHLGDSGESAWEAFGDPTRYARELAGRTTPLRDRSSAGTWARTGLGLAATVSVPRGLFAVVDSTAVSLTWGGILTLGLTVAMIAALLSWPTPTSRLLVKHPAASAALLACTLGLLLGGLFFFRNEVATLDAWETLGGGLAALLAASWFAIRQPLDLIAGPNGLSTKQQRRAQLISAGLFPVAVLMVVAAELLLRAAR